MHDVSLREAHSTQSFVCMRKADIRWLVGCLCVSVSVNPGYLLPQYKKGLVNKPMCIKLHFLFYVHKIAFSFLCA